MARPPLPFQDATKGLRFHHSFYNDGPIDDGHGDWQPERHQWPDFLKRKRTSTGGASPRDKIAAKDVDGEDMPRPPLAYSLAVENEAFHTTSLGVPDDAPKKKELELDDVEDEELEDMTKQEMMAWVMRQKERLFPKTEDEPLMPGQLKPLKIDVHTHIMPKSWPKWKGIFGYGGFVELRPCQDCTKMDMYMDNGRFFRTVEENVFNPDARVRYMDSVGVDVQVLSTVPVLFSYWAKPEHTAKVARMLNDDLSAAAATHPTRFIAMGTLPMNAPVLAAKELKRCVTEIGLAGVQIGSHINDWSLAAPELEPIWTAAEEVGAALFIHPWDMQGREALMSKYWLPWLVEMPAETSFAICSMIFGGVFERHPKLRVLFAHAGGSFPATVGRVQHGFDCRPDLCAVDNPVAPRSYCGRFWVDSLAHDKKSLKLVADTFGVDRICLGSDYPFPLGETYPLKREGELIEKSDFTPTEKAKMFSGNALQWLGVDSTRFRPVVPAPATAAATVPEPEERKTEK